MTLISRSIFKPSSLLYIILGCSCLTAGAQESIRIESMMAEEEFEASGLDGLSDQELENLNRWLERYLPQLADQMPDAGEKPSAITVVEQPEQVRTVTESRSARNEEPPQETVRQVQPPVYGQRQPTADVISVIEGTFTGWDGETVFRLANGQIYQQRRPGRWKTELVDPEVRVRKSFISFELEVDGHSIGVKRIR